jgi:hypothetical protein
MAQALYLDIPTPSKLTKAHEFLCEAHVLVTDVRSLFFNGDDFATAARLKDILGRLADEVQAVERLIEQAGSSPLKRRDMCMAVTRRGRSRGQGRALSMVSQHLSQRVPQGQSLQHELLCQALSFTSPQLQSAPQGGIYGRYPIRNPADRA